MRYGARPDGPRPAAGYPPLPRQGAQNRPPLPSGSGEPRPRPRRGPHRIHPGGAPDPATGLPVVSLYGRRRAPSAPMLAGLDTLVCDLQDVGARYYTFVWT